MAAGYRWAGFTGLCMLTSTLVLAVALATLRTSRRLGLSWSLSAAGLLWLGLVGYSRFNLRPELFGYVAFAGELALLGPMLCEPRRAARLEVRQIVAISALHLLFVNLHSYWPLGLFVGAAIFCECSVRSFGTSDEPWRQARLRSGLLLVSMLVLCLVNPWTWRLAALPFETLVYLREHQIGAGPGAHPWSRILEFRPTLYGGFPARASDFAALGLLLLAALGSVAALVRRRFALFIVLAGMAAVALSMRRNVAPAALAVVPLGLATSSASLERVTRRWPWRPAATLAFSAGVVGAAAIFTFSIVTNRFYEGEGHPMRFGVGVSRANLPIGAARWLDAHLPNARVWCDMKSSSTLHFFTKPHRELPILSNTWAYPPAIMADVSEIRSSKRSLERLVDDYGADAVVIDHHGSSPLFAALVNHPAWELVHLEGRHALFARAAGSQAELVRARSLSALRDPQGYVARQRLIDPALESALFQPGVAYLRAGLGELAVETFSLVVRERPDWAAAWNHLGLSHLMRARRGREGVSADLASAERAFVEALELDPGLEAAIRNLEKLELLRSRRSEREQRGRNPL
jgi:hypothetical protein